MGNRRRTSLKRQITVKLSNKTVSEILKHHKIELNKCIEYHEFLLKVFETLYSEYLGDDIEGEELLRSHFNWVWNKASVGKYRKFRNDDTNDNDLIVRSIFEYVYPAFYLSERDKKTSLGYLNNLFQKIFIFEENRTIIELDTLIDLYEKFTKIC